MITLLGALLTAVLPEMRHERWAHKPTPCGTFVDALAVLRVLYLARGRDSMMVDTDEIRLRTHIGYEESQSLLEQMQAAGWVGLVRAEAPKKIRWVRGKIGVRDRWVLLANPAMLALADVYRHFVFEAQTQREQELAVVQLVGQAVDVALGASLAAYFDGGAPPAADAALQGEASPLKLAHVD